MCVKAGHHTRSASESGPHVPSEIETILQGEQCNVVLTHTNADFDSLAGACLLAKLWSIERPALPTHVVTPRGVNPLVGRFLAYHKHLLPLRGFKTIREEDIRAVGVVDTQTRDRLGPAAPWLQAAEHIVVVDHHTGVAGDIEPDEYIVEPVGSATTVLVERLRALVADGSHGDVELSETEATLFALGIRADTGALSFPATTPRDAYALAWLMEQGCSQSAIAEFGQARLSAHQRDLLAAAMSSVGLRQHQGLKLASVVLDTGRGFVTGMASVCEELLQLLGCDVVMLGVVHANAKGQTFLSLIGRGSARAEGRAVDLNAVLNTWGGGGHPAAAAASVRLDTVDDAGDSTGAVPPQDGAPTGGAPADIAEGATSDAQRANAVLERTVEAVVAQVPQEMLACDVMALSHDICRCGPSDTMEHVLALMNRMGKKAAHVLGDGEKLLGFIKYRDPVKAAQAGKGQQSAKAWMRKELVTVGAHTPFTELEELLLEGSTGRLHVVDDDGRLIGLISRTDLLRHHRLYSHDLASRVI